MAKPAAKTTAKPAAPAKSTPAKSTPAAKAAAKAAEVETEEVEIAEGSTIVFTGYADDVPQEERLLTEGESYEVVGFTEPEGDDPGGDILVQIENPDFNAKKRESESNPKFVTTAVMEGEYELAGDEEGDAEEEAEEDAAEEAAEEVVEEAPKTKAKAGAKATGKTASKTADKAEAAKAPAKKTVGKPAAKAKTKEAEPEAEETADADALPDLENEDPEVLALIEGSEDLVEVAQSLESEVAVSEYRLGGILYHIKKDKAYLGVENGEELYGPTVKGGFAAFLRDYFNVEYRKAMYLIDIYVAFTMAGIENPAEKVAAMGWAKAAKIARPMMADDSTPDDLIELASTHKLADLSEALKDSVTVGGTREGGTKVERLTLKFRLLADEGASVNGVLEAIKEQHGLVDIGAALVWLCDEFTSQHVGEAAETAKAPAKKTVGKPAAKKATAKA